VESFGAEIVRSGGKVSLRVLVSFTNWKISSYLLEDKEPSVIDFAVKVTSLKPACDTFDVIPVII